MSNNRRYQLETVDSKESPARLGKVVHDSRGTAVWHWDIATGVLARKSVEELLTSLDAPGILSLDGEPDDQTVDWSGDPYNRTVR
jgi:hypothetical protein